MGHRHELLVDRILGEGLMPKAPGRPSLCAVCSSGTRPRGIPRPRRPLQEERPCQSNSRCCFRQMLGLQCCSRKGGGFLCVVVKY